MPHSTTNLVCLTELFLSDEMIEQVHDFEEECVDAYFHESEEANKTCAEERIRLTTERYVIM